MSNFLEALFICNNINTNINKIFYGVDWKETFFRYTVSERAIFEWRSGTGKLISYIWKHNVAIFSTAKKLRVLVTYITVINYTALR